MTSLVFKTKTLILFSFHATSWCPLLKSHRYKTMSFCYFNLIPYILYSLLSRPTKAQCCAFVGLTNNLLNRKWIQRHKKYHFLASSHNIFKAEINIVQQGWTWVVVALCGRVRCAVAEVIALHFYCLPCLQCIGPPSHVPRAPQRGINSVSSLHSNTEMYTAQNITFWYKGVTDLDTAYNTKKNLFAFHIVKVCSFDSAVLDRSSTADNSEIFGLQTRHFINVKNKSILNQFN